MAIRIHKTRISEGHRKEAGQVKGAASELAVLLLHQRFTMESLLDGSLLALPSYLSEDNNILDQDGTKISNCWDISVYTEYPPEEPKIAHRIQVKSRFDKRTQKYDSDIPVICIDRDLAANYAERSDGVEPITIVRERCLEFAQTAGEMIVERLDARMEKLLECVGQHLVVVPEEGLEPSSLAACDFESHAYTNSATPARIGLTGILYYTLLSFSRGTARSETRHGLSSIRYAVYRVYRTSAFSIADRIQLARAKTI